MARFSPLFMMNTFKEFSILAWNVRGFANRTSKNHVGDLIRRYKPDIIFLFETHTLFASAESFWARENYVKIEVQEVQGHSGVFGPCSGEVVISISLLLVRCISVLVLL